MVAEIRAALDAITTAGGQILDLQAPATSETFARFRDPAGNVLGVYQQPGLAEMEAKYA